MKPLDLAGRNLLILGFGRTGSRVAPRALGFGMRVHALDPYVDRSVMEAAGCTVVEDLHAVLPEMDAVTVHTPLNDETRGIIGAKELALMKRTAFVVNTPRAAAWWPRTRWPMRSKEGGSAAPASTCSSPSRRRRAPATRCSPSTTSS